ncbi:hypothetical protein [Streptomyces sp. NPDC000410]|uniref:hypothetical protein n=1 Tax=Streptomyces sp. NPDC000410 TaxID=3154254 RepID=UPI00332AF3C3
MSVPVKVVSGAGHEWLLTERIGSGSEGVVYAVDDPRALVAKLVPDPPDPAAYRRRVERLVRQRREPRTVRLLAGTPARLAWPMVAVRTVHDRVDGYVMPDMRGAFQPFVHLLSPDARRSLLPGATWATALAAAESLARLLAGLHAEGYVVGDLKPDNLWVDGRSGLVGMADVDSWQFTDGLEVFPGRMRTPGYTAPELIGPGGALWIRPDQGVGVPPCPQGIGGGSGAVDRKAEEGGWGYPRARRATGEEPCRPTTTRRGAAPGHASPAGSTRHPRGAPVSGGSPDSASDDFVLAVLVHQLLLSGLHPFAGHPTDGGDYLSYDDNVLRGRCRITDRTSVTLPRSAPPADLLPRRLAELLRAAFGGRRRPRAALWAEELAAARAPGRLTVCAAHRRHVYTVERPWCPWCDQAERGVDSYPDPGTGPGPRSAEDTP